ncbi:amidophosphoribosyltransferase [Shewanella waksmanii]|uniref:amidophosphoribosyltransferase n=1 Tax=Shewanella waksmanii TaxID=213783 RepID=UPI00048DA301|nr:amidophosphoribosyltransferase [Shewanella waksmanii]
MVAKVWLKWLAKLPSIVAASLPNSCLMCHQQVEHGAQGVCKQCFTASIYQADTCLGCGKVLQIRAKYCGACQVIQPLSVVAACRYYDGLGVWVAAIKYHTQLAILPALSAQLSQRILYANEQDWIRMPQVIVPVPLHPNRLRQRGFNQAFLIAQRLAKALELPIDHTCIKRILDTPAQAGLSGKQRRANLTNAFSVAQPFAYQRIALVDDVVTTGTTVHAIAGLLAKQGVHVQVWCLARAEAPQLSD